MQLEFIFLLSTELLAVQLLLESKTHSAVALREQEAQVQLLLESKSTRVLQGRDQGVDPLVTQQSKYRDSTVTADSRRARSVRLCIEAQEKRQRVLSFCDTTVVRARSGIRQQ